MQMSGMSAKITERRREGRKGQMGDCTVVLECKTRVHQLCKGSTRSAKGTQGAEGGKYEVSRPSLYTQRPAPIVSHIAAQFWTQLSANHRGKHRCTQEDLLFDKRVRERFEPFSRDYLGGRAFLQPGPSWVIPVCVFNLSVTEGVWEYLCTQVQVESCDREYLCTPGKLDSGHVLGRNSSTRNRIFLGLRKFWETPKLGRFVARIKPTNDSEK